MDALFEGLSDDDRYHRFFNLCDPARKFVQQMTQAEDEAGYRLVAVVSGAEDALLAEAGYAILPDGDVRQRPDACLGPPPRLHNLHRDKFSDMRMAIGAAQPARLRQRGNP